MRIVLRTRVYTVAMIHYGFSSFMLIFTKASEKLWSSLVHFNSFNLLNSSLAPLFPTALRPLLCIPLTEWFVVCNGLVCSGTHSTPCGCGWSAVSLCEDPCTRPTQHLKWPSQPNQVSSLSTGDVQSNAVKRHNQVTYTTWNIKWLKWLCIPLSSHFECYLECVIHLWTHGQYWIDMFVCVVYCTYVHTYECMYVSCPYHLSQ